LPELYRRILETISNPEVSVSQVSELVAEDPGLCARFLQIVNSAFFGLPTTISNVSDAVSMLGLRSVSQVLLSTEAFHLLAADSSKSGFSHAALQRDSVLVSRLASGLVPDPALASGAATAGMLHDLGSLLLLRTHGKEFLGIAAEAERSGVPQWKLEREAFGMTHAEIGAVLLGVWGLPLDVVEAVAFHHSPENLGGESLGIAVAVHFARQLLDAHRQRRTGGASAIEFDRDLLLRLGLDEVPEEWWQRVEDLDGAPRESRIQSREAG
jgi:HD-like signal output (HDOD) protein